MSTALLLLFACRPEVADTADTSPVDWTPDLPTASCGGAAHGWASMVGMGALLDAERDDVLSIDAAAVDQVLATIGWTQFSPLPYGVEIWRIRYQTQDRGVPVEATGFVALPAVASTLDVPLLLWLHPTTGFNDACAPTNLDILGAAYPMLFAAMGFGVVAPDYLGMAGWGDPSGQLHPYTIAEPTAVASLDAARAGLALVESEGLSARPDPARLIHWGASEGGFAALWSDRYQPRYAPEFTSVAALSVVPPTDLPALVTRGMVEVSETTAGAVAVLLAMSDWYGQDPEPLFAEGIAEQALVEMTSSCSEFAVFEGVEAVDDLFSADFITAASDEDWGAVDPWGCFLEENSVSAASWPRESSAPVLMALAEEDDLAWAPAARDDLLVLCDQGYAVEHLECAGANHAEGAVDSLDEQLAWLEARLADAPLEDSCTIQEPIDCAADSR